MENKNPKNSRLPRGADRKMEVVGKYKKTNPDLGPAVIFTMIISFIVFGGIIFFTDNYYMLKISRENFTIRQEINKLKAQIRYLQSQLEERTQAPIPAQEVAPTP